MAVLYSRAVLNPPWGRRGEGWWMERKGRGENAQIYVTGIRGGGILEPAASVTVQFLSRDTAPPGWHGPD